MPHANTRQKIVVHLAEKHRKKREKEERELKDPQKGTQINKNKPTAFFDSFARKGGKIPSGIKILKSVNYVSVERIKTTTQDVYERNFVYQVLDKRQNRLFLVEKKKKNCSFELRFYDFYGKVSMTCKHPYNCCHGCFAITCCTCCPILDIYRETGRGIGKVFRPCRCCCQQVLKVHDREKVQVLDIIGDLWVCCCKSDCEFYEIKDTKRVVSRKDWDQTKITEKKKRKKDVKKRTKDVDDNLNSTRKKMRGMRKKYEIDMKNKKKTESQAAQEEETKGESIKKKNAEEEVSKHKVDMGELDERMMGMIYKEFLGDAKSKDFGLHFISKDLSFTAKAILIGGIFGTIYPYK